MQKKAVILGAALLAMGAIAWAKRSQDAATYSDVPAPESDPATWDYLANQAPDSSTTLSSIDDWMQQNILESEYVSMTLDLITQRQTLSPSGLDKIKGFEGFSATPYSDHKGNSIGYGHLIKAGENLTFVTREQAAEILSRDVAWAENSVRKSVQVALTQAQFDSLVSLCFNIGQGAFEKSTLVAKLNAGDSGASAQFDRWVYASGSVNASLVARRQQERADFETA